MKEKNEIILFEDGEVKLEVNMQDETVWLTQEQMSNLFCKSRSTINEHIKNIYEENELNIIDTMRKFGNSEFSYKPTNYYNLDVIISVGYRVKSKEGTKFRQWANKVLKEYMLKGYAINKKRLEYLEKTVKLVDIATRLDEDLRSDESYNMLRVISDYTKALETLDNYDHHDIKKPKGNINKDKIITYEECLEIINQMPFRKTSDVFIDGNKRIGATLFLFFLNSYGLLKKEGKNIVEPETLVAITLFVAQSNSKEKDVVIDLLMNIIMGL